MTLSKLAAKVFSKVNYSFNILILTSKPTKCSTVEHSFFSFFTVIKAQIRERQILFCKYILHKCLV